MIKFTQDQLAIIEIIGYTPKLVKDNNGNSVLRLDLSSLTKEQKESISKYLDKEINKLSND
jgi:hypothetical protein